MSNLLSFKTKYHKFRLVSIKAIIILFLSVFSLNNTQAQTISSTGSRATNCSICTPDGWTNNGGTPDVSSKNIAANTDTTGGGATWLTAPLPNPPTGDITWISIRDVGSLGAEESVNTTLGSIVAGKVYKITFYNMTSKTDLSGAGGWNYAGTYETEFQFQIAGYPKTNSLIGTDAHDQWTKEQFIFIGDPDGSGNMNLSVYPGTNSGAIDAATSHLLQCINLAVDLNAIELIDTDGDGIDDTIDVDDDNDGILDTVETTIGGTTYDPLGDADGDKIPNYFDVLDNTGDPGTIAGDGSTTSYTDANGDGIADIFDFDDDGIPNHLDLDSDNDGIPDNIEAQSTTGYIAPSGSGTGITDANSNGLDDNYETSQGGTDITPVNTDAGGEADYRDLDSDGDGASDSDEANLIIGGSVGANGLVNTYDNGDTYADVNGSFDNTQTDNFPDGDSDVGGGGDVDYRDTDTAGEIDTDLDGIPNSTDVDDDNDGILDITESGGNEPDGDADGDGILNYLDTTNGGGAGDGSTTNYTDADSNGIPDVYDTDGDGIPNHLDLDSDNDGIPDNIEAQSSLNATYITPSGSGAGITDANSNGLDDNYETSQGGTDITPVNTDGTGDADYLDTDSDDDGVLDRVEANLSLSGFVGINGLDSNYDNGGADDYSDVNGSFDNTPQDNLPDADADVASGGDLDYRDADSLYTDNDNDGVVDSIDLDDDNDGILDTEESGGFDPSADADADGTPNYKDPDFATGVVGDTINTYGIWTSLDPDDDGIPNHFDLDSDGDGIPDNIEAQSTVGYITPNGTFDANGVDTAYTGGLTPQNTDTIDEPDYLDTDADNDGILDRLEAGITLSGVVGTNGLDNNYDNGDNYTDVNGSFDNSQSDNFPDADGDVFSSGDVDYRDDTSTGDNDGDGINDEIDLDDDNDGILDSEEYGTFCSLGNINANLNWLVEYTNGTGDPTTGDDPIIVNPNLTINNVGVTLSRFSNITGTQANYKVNDAITANGTYNLWQWGTATSESRHIFDFDAPIRNLTFTIYDLNKDAVGTDNVQILLTQEDGSTYNLVAADYTTGVGNSYIGSNTFEGTTTATDPDARVTINNIPVAIIKMQIVYKNTGDFVIPMDIAIGNLSFCVPLDSDGDGIFDYKDLDSDNDGIPDNIEAQSTTGFIAPTNTYSATGIDVAYGTGLTTVDTDGDGSADYIDLDSDADGTFDIAESGGGLTDTAGGADGMIDAVAVGTNGLHSTLEASDDYADVNGTFDDTQTDNFTDTDGDVNSGGDVDYRDDIVGIDTDGDGVANSTDVDDDNDGILDTVESGGHDPDGDEDNDGILNYLDTSDDGAGGPGGTTDYTDADSNGIPDVYDTDGDGIANHLDIDADNDGIPDNVEAQTTLGYVAPTGTSASMVDTDGDGLDDAYDPDCTPCGSVTGTDISTSPNDDDGDTTPDYLDSDSDNDGTPDIQENGDADNTVSGVDTDGDGLDDNFEGSNTNDGYDVNDEINTPQTDLPDVDSDVATGGPTHDVDFRDDVDDAVTPGVAGNVLWLRADKLTTGTAPLTDWQDFITGSTLNHATATAPNAPNLTAGGLNFNPVTVFDGVNDFMQITNGILGNATYTDTWVYVVSSTSVIGNDFVFLEAMSAGERLSLTIPWSDSNSYYDFGNTGGTGRIFTNWGSSVNTFNLWTMSSSTGTATPTGFRKNISRDGLSIATSDVDNTVDSRTSNNSNFYVGSLDGTVAYFDGEIAEIMVFTSIPTSKEQQHIQSYLAIKYGITLDITDNDATITEGDYLLKDTTTKIWDYTANSTYHNDVAGIGRDDEMTLTQKQSMSVNSDAIIAIGLGSTTGSIVAANASNAGSFTSNKDFLVWGNDNGVVNTVTSTELICAPETVIGRTWKIVENGAVGTVEVTATKATIDAALTTPNTVKVLKVADDATFTTNVEYIPLATSSITVDGVATAVYSANHDFNGTKYFTYSEINGIFWTGDDSSWNGGNNAGTSGAPSTLAADTDKVLVIDAQAAGNNATLPGNAIVECVWVKTGSKLMIPTGNYLEFDEDFILDGEIKIIGDGQLIQTHIGLTNVEGSGRIFKDQTATVPNTFRYHYWTSPVVELNKSTYTVANVMKDGTTPTSEASTAVDINFTWDSYNGDTTNPITIANYWIWTFFDNTVRDDWVQIRENTAINKGQGYTMKSTGAANQNFTFVGTPNDGSITFTLSPNTTSLLGNPYPSSLDINDFITTNSSVMDGTVYFWEHTGEDNIGGWVEGHGRTLYYGGYSQRNISMGIAANTTVSGTLGLGTGTYTAPSRYAAVAQGFFVSSSATGGALRFENAHRSYNANSFFFRNANTTSDDTELLPILKLGFEYYNENTAPLHRQIGISFRRGNSFKYESGYDSELYDLQPTDMYWKFNQSDKKMVIAGVRQIYDQLQVPLTLVIDTDDPVYILTDEKKNINHYIYLYDIEENIYYDISNSIELSLPKGTYSDRFILTFSTTARSTAGIDDIITNDNVHIFTDNDAKEIVIKNSSNLTLRKVELFNVLGQKVKNWNTLENIENRLNVSSLANAFYIVKLYTNKGVISKKVLIE